MRARDLGMTAVAGLATLFAACGFDSIDLAAKTCPCPDHLECNPASNRCVPRGSSGDAAAAGQDAAAIQDASQDTGGAVPVTVANDAFESGTSCDPWTVRDGTATVSAPGHSSSRSCRLCVATTTDKPRLHRTFTSPSLASWTISAWGMRAVDGGAPTDWEISLGDDRKEKGPVTATFQTLEFSTAAAMGEVLNVSIELDSITLGDCMMIDDILVIRTP
jgi:hypothetical protein